MNDLPRLLSRLTPGEPVGIILPDGAEGAVIADRLALVRKSRGAGAIVRQVDGAEFPAALDFATLAKRLGSSSNWFKPHSEYLVNLDHLKRIMERSAGRHNLILTGDAVAPLTSPYFDAFKKRLDLPSLDHVIKFNRVAHWMLKERLQDIKNPINLMLRPELIATFGSSGVEKIIVSDVIGNFLWQFVNRIRAGVQAPLTGRNVRSLWYLIKPALSKIGAISGMDRYKTVSDKLADYVSKGMMRYREFGLVEEGNWVIGDRRPEIIITGEKRGHIGFLRILRQEFGTSIIALGGKPKQISSEYFTDAFKAAVPGYWKKNRVLVIALIDYDPSGWIIGKSFLKDLKIFGIKNPRHVDLVRPSNFTPEELEVYKCNLIKDEGETEEGEDAAGGDASTLKAWMKEFGGINGEPYGLETDALMLYESRIRSLIDQVIKSWDRKGARRHE